tara:strand:- start:63 stop:548 length:486 start_codon:yes stop_codon:yes gene_type:complete
MEITQIAQKIKILSLCSIKRLFKLFLNKITIFLSLFLFSCSNYFIQAEEIKPKNLKCGNNSSIEFFEENGVFTPDNKAFNYKLKLINKDLDKDNFNFIYISKPKGAGYTLEVEKISKKKSKHKIYFKENKPPEGAAVAAVTASTYCFLKIDNLDEVEVFIK